MKRSERMGAIMERLMKDFKLPSYKDSLFLLDEIKRLRGALEAMTEWWDQDDGIATPQTSERLMKARGLAEQALSDDEVEK